MGGGGLHGDQMQRCNSLLDLVTAALQAFLNYHCHRYSRLAMANFQPSLGSVNCLTFQQFCIYIFTLNTKFLPTVRCSFNPRRWSPTELKGLIALRKFCTVSQTGPAQPDGT